MGGGLIEWAKQMFLPQKTENPYKVVEEEAANAGTGARGIIFLPYLLGERAPLWNPNARGVLFGLERTHTRQDIFRAVFESTAYSTRQLVAVQRSLGIVVNEIFLSGGLVRIPLISQIKADVLGVPAYVPKEFESTALGAAILGRTYIDKGNNIFDICDSMVKIEHCFEPRQREHQVYTQCFQIFQSLYTSLKGAFNERRDVIQSPEYRALEKSGLEAKENL